MLAHIMSDINKRVPENAPGKFYVDWTCIYCDLCAEIAPAIFAEHQEHGYAHVVRQPENAAELQLAVEAAESCPTDSIGTDGDKQRQQSSLLNLVRRLIPK